MKYIVFILIITKSSFVYAQPKKPNYSCFMILYGQKFLSHNTFNGELNTIDDIKFNGNLSYVGLGLTNDLVFSRGSFLDHYSNMYYTQVIPQKIKINDSITTTITGFNIGFTLWGKQLFRASCPFNTNVLLGANTGRLRLIGNNYTTQKNPYFSPKIIIYPTLTLKQIRFGIQIEYEVDISKKNWRKTNFSNSDKIALPQTSSTGLTLYASIGYVIKNDGRKKHKKGGIIID